MVLTLKAVGLKDEQNSFTDFDDLAGAWRLPAGRAK